MTATIDHLLDVLDVRPRGWQRVLGRPLRIGTAPPLRRAGHRPGSGGCWTTPFQPYVDHIRCTRTSCAPGVVGQTDRVRGDHGPRRSIVLDARSASSSGIWADLHDDGFLPRRRTRPRAPDPAALGPSTGCPPDVRRSIQRTGRTSTRSGQSVDLRARRRRPHPAPHRSSGTQTWMRVTQPLP